MDRPKDAGQVAVLVDPVAAARRASQRAERVGSGVAELRQWLRDRVRSGLAGADRAGYGPTDALAARLVDAQAPGLASWVRSLAGVAASGDGWPQRLLTELALLNLLAAGYENIDDLPAPLASTIRSRVGFIMRVKDVLATPPVRDFWNVLSMDDDEQERLTVRRVQLHGSRTGRGAVVLSFSAGRFSAGGQPLDSSLVPGTCIDAGLHFYPASVPVRAAVGERYGDPGPLMHTGGVSIPEAVAAWAAALASDPWLTDLPLILRDVVPVPPPGAGPGRAEGWFVRSAASGEPSALPLRPGPRLWSLLAVSGGAPVTLAAGVTPAGLRPVAALTGDRVVTL